MSTLTETTNSVAWLSGWAERTHIHMHMSFTHTLVNTFFACLYERALPARCPTLNTAMVTDVV